MASTQITLPVETVAEPIDVQISSIPLPIGASTSDRQDTGNSSLNSIESTLTTGLAKYAKRMDEASDTVTYYGEALPGTADSAANWRIYKQTITGAVTDTKWADGDSNFDNIWDDRASLSYV